jgi:phosphoribosylamine---glycine ligase
MHTVLVIGSGGREHALCWKLKQSPEVSKVYCSPGNGGIAAVAECLELNNQREIVAFCQDMGIGLVVIGPEQPLVEGLANALKAINIPVFGPSKAAARLEASKGFTKALCSKYDIPTAAYGVFTSAGPAKAYIARQQCPIVVKADGLAAGKGVIIAQSLKEAEDAVDAMFGGAFGTAGATVVIEEFLEGEEVSFFAICDGQTAIPFGAAQDHKRALDGDKGPNTGGMGAYSPTPVFTPALQEKVMEEIIHPTMRAMRKEGSPFAGVLFAGLMLTRDGPKLLEYNTRFGDPETQSLMRRLDGDLFPLLRAAAAGNVESAQARMLPQASICVVMAAKGYPGGYEKGSVISGLEVAAALPGIEIFHAGTERRGEEIISVGGRVLGITAVGDTIAIARDRAYAAVDAIRWPQGFCRRDIGWRAVAA